MTFDQELPNVLQNPISTSVGLLLEGREPVRLAWVGTSGAPHVTPMWFHWNGDELVMCTFAGSKKLASLTDRTLVAATIDTAQFPYRSIGMRGRIARRDVVGIANEYRLAANRYLGSHLAERWVRFLGDVDQVVLSLRPTQATTSDMAADSPFMEVLE